MVFDQPLLIARGAPNIAVGMFIVNIVGIMIFAIA